MSRRLSSISSTRRMRRARNARRKRRRRFRRPVGGTFRSCGVASAAGFSIGVPTLKGMRRGRCFPGRVDSNLDGSSHHLRRAPGDGQSKTVPPYWRVMEESAWVKLLKISSSFRSSMPMPVSRTEKRSRTISPGGESPSGCTGTEQGCCKRYCHNVKGYGPRGCELDRIAHQVDQNLLHPSVIPQQECPVSQAKYSGSGRGFYPGGRPHDLIDIVDQFRKREPSHIQQQLPRLNLGQFQYHNSVDKRPAGPSRPV